ncbi:imidazolonepropionase [Alteromonas halophila]|uniref:Imidazolonepropionase n=1 Tax=Alteromonas halophila TaxID=516698 RepID=A0A918N000_9ALTE|nr:imidazolonepropionase [Alteromonas halophila]GGW88081.1 imidazolonepropionase [Alteromonas halophila]
MSEMLITHARIASMQAIEAPFGELEANSVRVRDGVITEIGHNLTTTGTETHIDAKGQWLLPGFIDCHTHIVYGGDRADEFARRLEGVSYQQISQEGGGIKRTVRDTRATSEDELRSQSARRVARLVEEGVTTIEVKSGYGLDTETERRQLRVADALAREFGITVKKTYLGAHAMPPDCDTDADAYIDFVCNTMIPQIASEGLADAVDVFCENVGFTLAQTERVFTAAKQAGLPVKGHVEQLSDSKGARLAAQYQALSVDHLEYLHSDDIDALRQAGTVAVILPGAFYYLKETQEPPIQALRDAGVRMAVATDINPGTSPVASLLTSANMASVLFAMTTEEVIRGMTVHAAAALGLTDRGVIDTGKRADLTLWAIPSPASLVYEINGYRPTQVISGGKHVI